MPDNNQPYHEKNAPAGPEPEVHAPGAPPLPKACNGSNIFDCLASGSLLFFFCMMSWTHGETPFGAYAFFRGGTINGSLLIIVTLLSGGAVGLGLFLLYWRIKHLRYCAVYFPKPKKPKGPNAWADMRDALDQLLGLTAYEGLDKDAARAAPVKKRVLRNWFTQEKTRVGLSSFILALLMYLTPGFVIHLMGQHVLMYFLLEFMAVMTTLVMWLIAWVELGE